MNCCRRPTLRNLQGSSSGLDFLALRTDLPRRRTGCLPVDGDDSGYNDDSAEDKEEGDDDDGVHPGLLLRTVEQEEVSVQLSESDQKLSNGFELVPYIAVSKHLQLQPLFLHHDSIFPTCKTAEPHIRPISHRIQVGFPGW